MESQGQCLPWFEPAAAVLTSKWAKTQAPEAVASVAALVEGGWWTQERLFEANFAADPICRWCGRHIGNLFHCCLLCPTHSEKPETDYPEFVPKFANLGVICPPRAPLANASMRNGSEPLLGTDGLSAWQGHGSATPLSLDRSSCAWHRPRSAETYIEPQRTVQTQGTIFGAVAHGSGAANASLLDLGRTTDRQRPFVGRVEAR